MLVRVTQIHDGEIKELTRNMMKIVEVLDFMAEYNPGLLMMKIEVELSRFYSILACDFTCIFNKFLAIHDCLSGRGSWKSTVLPPLSTFCNSLGVFDALAPLVLGCGWFGLPTPQLENLR